MDHTSSTILAMSIVDKRQVGLKSPNMEIEGLKQCLASLISEDVKPSELVTDAHIQTAALMSK